MLALRLHSGTQHEREKIVAAQGGDKIAQGWLVEHWTPRIYRFTYRMLRNEQDASDITQETFVRALRNLKRFDPDRPFSTWIFRIARNASIDAIRKRKHRSTSLPEDLQDLGDSPLEQTAQSRRSSRIHKALEQLPPDYRDIIIFYHFEQMKYAEIADVLQIPIGTVMTRIFRARKQLRKRYEALGGNQ